MQTKEINNFKVKKVNTPVIDTSKIQGYDLFNELYANIFICARKKQGKTTIISNILRKCANKNTHVFFFVSTILKDDSYKEILISLDKMDVKYSTFINIETNGINTLKQIINSLRVTKKEDKQDDEEKEEFKPKIISIDETDDEMIIKIKKYKPRKIAPEYIFVFDDISNELSNIELRTLIKHNRHFKSKLIISSQYVNDLEPESRTQIDNWLLLGDQTDEKLEVIYESCDPVVDFDEFKAMFEDATAKKYNFFYIDKNIGQYRKNFNEEFIL
jgi:hypothetical protein